MSQEYESHLWATTHEVCLRCGMTLKRFYSDFMFPICRPGEQP